MNHVRAVDAANNTITVEAGCILEQVQEARAARIACSRFSLAAEGHLPDRRQPLHQRRRHRRAALRECPRSGAGPGGGAARRPRSGTGCAGCARTTPAMTSSSSSSAPKAPLASSPRRCSPLPAPKERVTAFAALRDLDAAVELLARCRAASGNSLVSFELLPRAGIDLALRHIPGIADPLSAKRDYYVLIELTASIEGSDLRTRLEIHPRRSARGWSPRRRNHCRERRAGAQAVVCARGYRRTAEIRRRQHQA